MHSQYLASQATHAAHVSDFGGSLPSSSTTSSLPPSHLIGPSSVSPTQPVREELKSHFATREGTYRLMTLGEYSRPNRVPLNQAGNAVCTTPVRVSFLSIPNSGQSSSTSTSPNAPSLVNGNVSEDETMRENESVPDRICFNVGREIYVYLYRGTTAAADLSKPVDKRVYKGTFPTCHHFNSETATATTCSLLIGFSAGQVQMIDPFQKDYQVSRLFNEERLVEKSAVTCIRWVPGHPQHFLVSHSSGCMYLYHEELPCTSTVPSYQPFKQGDKFSVWTCKAKSSRNPVYKWQIGQGAVHQFAFSPTDPNLLAVVGHDGYLRIFSYHSMELLSLMKSYFGGLLCLSWSPDGILIATGGEDDLVTVYSFSERRVVCRGLGHKSWISNIAFDPYNCSLEDGIGQGGMGSEEELSRTGVRSRGRMPFSSQVPISQPLPPTASSSASRLSCMSVGTPNGSVTHPPGSHSLVSYRLGSVGHDTQLCLWDITDEVLRQPQSSQRHRNSTLLAPLAELQLQASTPDGAVASSTSPNSSSGPPSGGTMEKGKKKNKLHRKGLAFAAKLSGGSNSERRSGGDGTDSPSTTLSSNTSSSDDSKMLGTKFCPRMHELSVIEPLVCKKIAHERLTAIEFRKDCFVTACQEGFICTWARPGRGAPSIVRREGTGGVSTTNSPQDVPTSSFNPSPQYWSS